MLFTAQREERISRYNKCNGRNEQELVLTGGIDPERETSEEPGGLNDGKNATRFPRGSRYDTSGCCRFQKKRPNCSMFLRQARTTPWRRGGTWPSRKQGSLQVAFIHRRVETISRTAAALSRTSSLRQGSGESVPPLSSLSLCKGGISWRTRCLIPDDCFSDNNNIAMLTIVCGENVNIFEIFRSLSTFLRSQN